MELFLNTGKSRFDVTGPSRMLRPELPRRFETLGESADGGIAICRVEGSGRRRRDRKALALDLVVGISGINRRIASWTHQAIRKIPAVAAVQSLGIPVGAEGSSKGHAVITL
jgi:hypothetical protein